MMIHPLLTHTLIRSLQVNTFQKFARRDRTEVQTRGLVNARKMLSVHLDPVFVLCVILEQWLIRIEPNVVGKFVEIDVLLSAHDKGHEACRLNSQIMINKRSKNLSVFMNCSFQSYNEQILLFAQCFGML